MIPLLQQPVFALYAICSAILIITFYALAFLTAKTRADRKAVINYEDVKINSGASVVEVEHLDVQRIKRAHMNALENAVPFFIIGFIYSQSAPSMMMAQGLFFSFVTIRVLHAVFYLSAKQPFRTMSFAIGALLNLTMVVQVLRAVL